MRKKGVLLVFVSDYKSGAEIRKYKVKREDGSLCWFEGVQTNDAPVKYLISRALKDENKIEKIICIVSKMVEKKGLDEFKTMVDDYLSSSKELETAYHDQKIEFYPVAYPEDEEEISYRASKVYRQLAASDCIGKEEGASVYIDYTGGLRDINFLMTAIIRYLEYHGISCKEIVYSSFNKNDSEKNQIYSLNCIYSMYQLLNGVEQFVSTGNAELLQLCYQNEKESSADELLRQIIKFSQAMSLCDVRDVDHIMDQLCDSLDQFDAKEEKGSFFSVMFGDLTSIIRKKMYIEKGRRYSYPSLIQWCLDNHMIQQALTLYVEKMPEFYCDAGLLEFSQEEAEKNKSTKTLGQTWRTEFFYGFFYDQFFEQLFMKELNDFGGHLREGYSTLKDNYPRIEQFLADDFRRLRRYMKTEQEKSAVDFLVKFLKEHYGKVIKELCLPYTKEKMKNCPKNANAFVSFILNHNKWKIYFLYNDKKKYEEFQLGTYGKKVLVLDLVKTYKGKIPQAKTEDNALIYGMMKYYLALKLIRNRINHASEQEVKEDEKKAIEQLEKKHGICMKIEFEQVKSLIQEGINHTKSAIERGKLSCDI